MKIGFLVVSYHTVNFFRPIIKNLIKRGHEVQIYAIDPLPAGAREDKFDTHRIDWHLFDFDPIYKFDPDKLVVFNGFFKTIHGSIKFLKARYELFHAEVAWFPQRDFIYIDRDIHDRSDISKKVAESTRVYDKELYESKKHLLDFLKNKYTPSTNAPPEIDPEKINIVLPLQLETDTSILYASPYFKDMESLVGFFDKCIRRYGDSVNLIVKNHPKWIESDFNKAFDNEKYSRCKFVATSSFSMNDYAFHSDAVVGINSTSLMEASIHRRPVFQTGGNVYSGHCTFPTYENLAKFLNKVKNKEFDEDYFIPSEIAILTMMANQISFRCPEDWIIDKLEGKHEPDYTRGLRDL